MKRGRLTYFLCFVMALCVSSEDSRSGTDDVRWLMYMSPGGGIFPVTWVPYGESCEYRVPIEFGDIPSSADGATVVHVPGDFYQWSSPDNWSMGEV